MEIERHSGNQLQGMETRKLEETEEYHGRLATERKFLTGRKHAQ